MALLRLVVLGAAVLAAVGIDAERTATTYGDRLHASTRTPFTPRPGLYTTRVLPHVANALPDHGQQVAGAAPVTTVDVEDDADDNGLLEVTTPSRTAAPFRHSTRLPATTPTTRLRPDRTTLFRRQRPTTTTVAPVEEDGDVEAAAPQDPRDLCRHSPNSYFCSPATRKRPQRVRVGAAETAPSTTTTTTTTTTEPPPTTTRRTLPVTMARLGRPKLQAEQPTILFSNFYLPAQSSMNVGVVEQQQPSQASDDDAVVVIKPRKRLTASRRPTQTEETRDSLLSRAPTATKLTASRPYSGLADAVSTPLGEDSPLFDIDEAQTTTAKTAFSASRRPAAKTPASANDAPSICDDPAHMFLCERPASSSKPRQRPQGLQHGRGGVRKPFLAADGGDEDTDVFEYAARSDSVASPLATISSRSEYQTEPDPTADTRAGEFAPEADFGYQDTRPLGVYHSGRPQGPVPVLRLGPSKLAEETQPLLRLGSDNGLSKHAAGGSKVFVDVADQSASYNEPAFAFKYLPRVRPGALQAAYSAPVQTVQAVQAAPQQAPQPQLYSLQIPQQQQSLETLVAAAEAQRQREEEHNNFAAHAILTALHMQADAMRAQGAVPAAPAAPAAAVTQLLPVDSSDTLTERPGKGKKNKKKGSSKNRSKPKHEPAVTEHPEDELLFDHPFERPGYGHGPRRPSADVIMLEPPRGAVILMDGHVHGHSRPPFAYRGPGGPARHKPRPVISLHRARRQSQDGYVYPKPTEGGADLPGSAPGDGEEGYDYPKPSAPFPGPGPSSPAPTPGPSPPPPGPPSPPPPGPPPPPPPPPAPPVPTPDGTVPIRPKPTPGPELRPTGPPPPAPGQEEEGYDYPPPGKPFPAPGPAPTPGPEGGVELPGPPEEPAPGPTPGPAPGPSPTPAPGPAPGPTPGPAPGPSPSPTPDGPGSDEGYNYPVPDKRFRKRKV